MIDGFIISHLDYYDSDVKATGTLTCLLKIQGRLGSSQVISLLSS